MTMRNVKVISPSGHGVTLLNISTIKSKDMIMMQPTVKLVGVQTPHGTIMLVNLGLVKNSS